MERDPIHLATRGSKLALAQARSVASTIEDHRRQVELVEISTTGDEVADELVQQLGTTGAFVRSLDQAVLDGEVDGAVHSMKDVPTEQPEELIIAAIPPRASPHDVLVTPRGATIDDLEPGAIVGTGSLRRRAQLIRSRPDLTIEPIRGNVDTRLVKLYASAIEDEIEPVGPNELLERAADRAVETRYDALILAQAGLERSGFAEAVTHQRLEDAVPAPGQGAIAVSSLDTDLAELLNKHLDDPRTRVETTVERRILARIGGGCIAPLGIHAVIQGEHVQTRVQVLDRDGEQAIELTRQLPVDDYLHAADELADELIERGAADLIERARRDAPGPRHRE